MKKLIKLFDEISHFAKALTGRGLGLGLAGARPYDLTMSCHRFDSPAPLRFQKNLPNYLLVTNNVDGIDGRWSRDAALLWLATFPLQLRLHVNYLPGEERSRSISE